MYAYIYGEIIEKEPENIVIECWKKQNPIDAEFFLW